MSESPSLAKTNDAPAKKKNFLPLMPAAMPGASSEVTTDSAAGFDSQPSDRWGHLQGQSAKGLIRPLTSWSITHLQNVQIKKSSPDAGIAAERFSSAERALRSVWDEI